MNNLYGIVPPMTTPFDEDEEINYDMLKKDVTHLVEKSKVHGLAMGGSTGEGYSLSTKELRDALETTIDAVKGKVPVIAGIIVDSTRQALERAKAIQGRPVYDLADQDQEYTKINGTKQTLQKNDVILKDDDGILASILYGPSARTSIKMETVNPLYLAWCPAGIDHETVDNHLSTITKYSKTAHGKNIETARHIV